MHIFGLAFVLYFLTLSAGKRLQTYNLVIAQFVNTSKMSTRHKHMKSLSREEGLFEIRDNRHKGCQLHLSKYVSRDTFLYSLKQLFVHTSIYNISKHKRFLKIDLRKNKKALKSWNSKTRVTSYEFSSTSYEFNSTSYKFKSTSYEFKSTSYEFNFTSQEFKPTSYEFKSTSYEFKSTSQKTKSTSCKIKSTNLEIKSTI